MAPCFIAGLFLFDSQHKIPMMAAKNITIMGRKEILYKEPHLGLIFEDHISWDIISSFDEGMQYVRDFTTKALGVAVRYKYHYYDGSTAQWREQRSFICGMLRTKEEAFQLAANNTQKQWIATQPQNSMLIYSFKLGKLITCAVGCVKLLP